MRLIILISIIVIFNSCSPSPKNGKIYIAKEDCVGYATVLEAKKMDEFVNNRDQSGIHEMIYNDNATFMLYRNNKVRVINGDSKFSEVIGLDSITEGQTFFINTNKLKPLD